MERSDVENQKYLKVFGGPFRSFCLLFSLKIGVIYIAIFDILVGITSLILGLDYLLKVFTLEDENLSLIIKFCQSLTTIIGIPFAILGLRGIIQVNPSDLYKYSKFKTVEFFIMLFLSVTRIIIHELHQMTRTLNNFLTFINELFGPFALFLMVKTVWSAYVRVKSGQNLLVNQGEELTPISIPSEEPVHLSSPSILDIPESNSKNSL